MFAGAGDVISGVQLTIDVLTKILEALGSIDRKIAIGIENKMGEDWEPLNAYFYSGTSDVPLPMEVPSGVKMLEPCFLVKRYQSSSILTKDLLPSRNTPCISPVKLPFEQ